MVDTELDPIAQPEIDITGGEDSGAVSFDAVVQVRPLVVHPGLRRPPGHVAGLAVTDEEVQHQVDRLRENDAELDVVDRPAIDGDLVTIDLHGNDASDAEVVGVDDYLYEVGSGTVVPELDAELHGAKAGAILAFDAANPESPEERIALPGARQRGQGQEAAGGDRRVGGRELGVRDVAELRDDIEERIRRVKLVQTQMALRQKALEALSGLVADE